MKVIDPAAQNIEVLFNFIHQYSFFKLYREGCLSLLTVGHYFSYIRKCAQRFFHLLCHLQFHFMY